MKKQEALKIILINAKEYEKNLNNKNLLFIFLNQGKIECINTMFLPRNFLHLTGVELTKKIGSKIFYDKCLNNKLSEKDFTFKKDGTTVLKLQILNQIVNIHKNAKMIGDYDMSKAILHTEKIAGTIFASIGFVFDKEFFVPNTALKEDIRTIVKKPQCKMLAIYSKNINSDKYSKLTYLAKNVNTENFPQHIKNKINENQY